MKIFKFDFLEIEQKVYILSNTEIFFRDQLTNDRKRKKLKKAIPKDIPIIWVNVIEPYEG